MTHLSILVFIWRFELVITFNLRIDFFWNLHKFKYNNRLLKPEVKKKCIEAIKSYDKFKIQNIEAF